MSNYSFIFIIFLITFGGMAFSVFYIKKETEKMIKEKEKDGSLPVSMIKQDIEAMRKKFEDGYSQINYQLGKVQEISRQIKEFQDFFRSPKLRGNIGEQILKDLLEQSLPKKVFSFQYKFNNGQAVDAIIKTSQGIVPIDSKFPMENFRKISLAKTEKEKEEYQKLFSRDIKKHINDIAKKYILPGEGTVDFALMYIPSESVYYEIALNQSELLDYGYQKKIYFVSPNSFYYFLKIVIVGLEGVKIEEEAKTILSRMKSVQQEAANFSNEFSVLLNHIERTKLASDRARGKFEKMLSGVRNLASLEDAKKEEMPVEFLGDGINNGK